MADTTILLATSNPGKLREVQAVLQGLPARLATLKDYPNLPMPVEDADTFEGNATIKALHYARLTAQWSLADDSGLEVDALDGQPGVRSARFAASPGHPTASSSDAANNAKLIALLANVPPQQRAARFRCAIVLASPERVLATGFGAIDGVIIDDPRGDNGFGYDPHFFVPACNMTTAQMSPEHKNRISHRGRALAAILPAVEKLLSPSA